MEEPQPPEEGECCGSGCSPCVWDLYYEKLEKYQNWKDEQDLKKMEEEEEEAEREAEDNAQNVESKDASNNGNGDKEKKDNNVDEKSKREEATGTGSNAEPIKETTKEETIKETTTKEATIKETTKEETTKDTTKETTKEETPTEVKKDSILRMEVFPLLFPEDDLFTSFHGLIPFQGREYKFRLQLGNNKSLKEASISVSPELKSILQGHSNTIKQRLAQSASLDAFLLEFKNILEQIARTKNAKGGETEATPNQMQLYSEVIKELQIIGWDKVVEISPELTSFKICILDSAEREHLISFKIPNDYPSSAPVCNAQFPIPLTIKWDRNGSLTKVLDQCKQVMESFQEFWNEMENLDRHTWVLEPEHPNPAATLRRIAIGNQCSVQIEVDPYRPKGLPECRFWGSDSFISPLKQQFNKNIHLWDKETRLLNNLQQVLEITFPSPQTSQKDDFLIECASKTICYTYRNAEGALPDRVCDYTKCSKPFHRICLYNWLKGVSSRFTFDTISGNCPNCSNVISVTK